MHFIQSVWELFEQAYTLGWHRCLFSVFSLKSEIQLNNVNIQFLPHRKHCVYIMDQLVNFIYIKLGFLMFVHSWLNAVSNSRLYTIKWLDNELERMLQEVVMDQFMAPSWHLPGWTKENDATQDSVSLARIWNVHLQNTNCKCCHSPNLPTYLVY